MKISVVTAVYNREATVAQAIRSVRTQSWPDIEHIVIDGASTDATLAEVEREAHPGLRVISEPDEGIYDALNKGIALATGDVVGMVHSDDFFAHERVIEKVAEAFQDPRIDAVYGDLDYVSSSDPSRIVRRWRSGAFKPVKLKLGWMPPHPTLFLRRNIFERHGVYDTSYRISSDYDAVLRYFGDRSLQAHYIPEVLVKMRTGGASGQSAAKLLRKNVEIYRILRANGVGGISTIFWKSFSKLGQFVTR